MPPAIVSASADTPPKVCRGLYCFWVDGLFIALSTSFYSAFMPLFLLGFGASNSQIGLMSGLSSFVGIVAYLAATRATVWLGGRKRMVVFARIWSRVTLLAVVAVPFLVSGVTAIYITIALVAVQAAIESVGAPAWTALVADIVPLPIRARYIASRNIAKSGAKTVAVAVAGQLIRALGFPRGYQASFFAGALVGFAAALAYAHIPVDEGMVGHSIRTSAGRSAFSKTSILYIAARTVWALGYQVAAPFFSIYVVKNLGGDESNVGLLASVGAVTAVTGLILFSRAVERYGLRRTWLFSGVMEALVPVLWAVAPSTWFALLPAAADGLLLAGLELVNLNTVLMLTSDQNRTEFAAVNSAILTAAAMVGPLLGGALSDLIGFVPIFLLGSSLSLIGCTIYYVSVPDPGASGDEDSQENKLGREVSSLSQAHSSHDQ